MNTQEKLPDYPLVYAQEPRLRLAVIYNPFDLTQTVTSELVYGQSRTLADYLDGLPEEAEWNVAYNGDLIERAAWTDVKPAPFSTITIVRVPEGGGGNSGKSIMRVVAMIAVMTFAAWAGPAIAGAMGIGTAATATAAASTSFTLAAGAATAAIGVAGSMAVNALLGPKAPKQENSTTYGADGAKNSAREGMVTPVTYGDFRVGGNMVDVFTRNFGSDQYLYIRTVLNDGEVEDITDIEVNQQPISSFNNVEIRIRKGELDQEDNDWFDESVRQFTRTSTITSQWTQHVTEGLVDRLRADVLMPEGLYFAKDDGRKVEAEVTLALEYTTVDAAGQPTNNWLPMPLLVSPQTTSRLYLIDKSSKAKRLTYESVMLPRGRYAMRIRRTQDDDPDDKRRDVCILTDFGEIDSDPTNVTGTANLSMRIKMTEQLNGIPTVTALVKGSKVNVYDEDGNVVAFQKSSNPADIVADLLFHPTRGADYSRAKMVWPKYIEFRNHCVEQGYEFHGTFDTVESLWDVAQTVAARGHATVLPRGTKFTFAIDRQAEPEIVFSGGNIFRDTFKTTWVSTAERANEIHLQFNDKTNGHKARTVRVTDNVAFARGEKQKIVTATGLGIVDLAEAVREAEFAARTNRYIKKMVEFDAPIEAIGLNIGDLALVQHNSMDFKGGAGGRLKAGSTAHEIRLDAPVVMQAGKPYSCIVVTSAIERYQATIVGINGARLTVSGIPDSPERIRRLVQGSVDVEVLSVHKIGSTWRLTVSDESALSNGPITLWDTDVVDERDVITEPGETSVIRLAKPLTSPPEQFSNFLFGERLSIRQPFRLKSIAGTDTDRRTLSFVQYDERVYMRGGFDTIEVDQPSTNRVPHVRGLTATFDRTANPDQGRYPVVATWTRPVDLNYAGADIYYQLGADTTWTFLTSVYEGNSVERDFSRGDQVRVKVVAFTKTGNRADFSTAPTSELFVVPFGRILHAPQNVSYMVPFFRGDATARITWEAPSDQKIDHYAVETQSVTQEQYEELLQAIANPVVPEDPLDPTYVQAPEAIALGEWRAQTTSAEMAEVSNLKVGTYAFRVRSVTGTSMSHWTYVAANIALMEMPVPTGVKLQGSATSDVFVGRDADFSWDDIIDLVNKELAEEEEGVNPDVVAVWNDYQVSIKDGETVLRTEYTRSPFWSYTFDKNAGDTPGTEHVTARRAFTFEIRLRGQQGQLSEPVIRHARNAQAALLPVQIERVENTATLVYSRPAQSDFGGIVVWTALDDGEPTAVAYRGASSPVIQIPAQRPGDEGKPTIILRYAFFDVFDDLNLNQSAAIPLEGTPPIVPEIPDLEELFDEIDDIRDAGEQVRIQLGTYAKDVMGLAKTQMGDILTNVRAAQERDKQDHLGFAKISEAKEEIATERLARTVAVEQAVSVLNDNIAMTEQRVMTQVDDAMAQAAIDFTAQTAFDDFTSIATQKFASQASDLGAIASTMGLLGVESPDGLSFILDTDKVKLTPTESLAQRNALTEARFNGTSGSYLLDTANAAASEAGAAVDTLQQMGVTIGQGNAYQMDANRIVAAPGELLSQRLSSIGARLDGALDTADVDARFDSKINASIGAGGVLSTFLQTSYTSKGDLNSAAGLLQQSIDGVSARASLFVDSNGRVGGVNLGATQERVDLEFLSDNFFFVDASTGIKTRVLAYSNGKWTFAANVSISGDLLVAGTITNQKLMDNVATRVEVAYDGNQVTLNNSTPTRIHGLWIPVEKASSPIDIDFNAYATFTHNATGSFVATVQLVRSRTETGGTVLQTVNINGSGMANDTWQGAIPIKFLDNPGADGNWHYYVQIFFNVGNMTTQTVTARYGKLTELKNNTSILGSGTGSGPGVGPGGGTSGGGGGSGGGEVGGGGGGEIEQPVIN